MTYQITESDIIAFTQGDCWVLAKEISKRTGWQVYALGGYRKEQHAPRYEYPLTEFDWVHMVVKTPTRGYLDVTGFVSETELTAIYLRHIEAYFGWQAQELVYEPVIGETDWAALTGKPTREHPHAPVEKVAASLIRQYHANSSQLAS